MFDSLTLPELKQYALQAENALHKLMVGDLEVTVSVGGFGSTTYKHTEAHQLQTYIHRLKAAIAQRENKRNFRGRSPIFVKF